MRAGQLRHYVSIEKQTSTTVTKNSYGEDVPGWTTDSKCWVKISPLRGNEYFQAKQIKSSVSHKIEMRYQTLSNSTEIGAGKCRIGYGTRIFNIEFPMNVDERNIRLYLICSESS